MSLRQEPKPQILRDVRVLILVDEDVSKPPLILRQHVLMLPKDRDHVEQQVAEIDGVQRFQPGLIGGVKLAAPVVEQRMIRRRDLVRRDRPVLPVVDDPGQKPRGPAFFVDVLERDELFHQPDLIVRVENGEVRLEPHKLGMAAQKLHADRVEGAEPRHPLDRLAQMAAHPVLHLACGLVGEGHGEDFVRSRRMRVQKMRDPRGQRLGLAGPRAREHEDGPVERLDRLALRRVQLVEIGRRARGHGHLAQAWAGSGHGWGVVMAAHGREPISAAERGKGVQGMFFPRRRSEGHGKLRTDPGRGHDRREGRVQPAAPFGVVVQDRLADHRADQGARRHVADPMVVAANVRGQ